MSKNNRLLISIGQGLFLMVGRPTITSWKTASRPKSAKPGTFGFNAQTNNLEYWNGSQWLAARLRED